MPNIKATGPVRRRILTIGLAVLLGLGIVGVLPGVASADPVYPVMNTSEYPPDGVYFRNSPNDADAIRITGVGVYAGERVALHCFTHGTNVQRRDGGVNTVWYLATNLTRPTAAGRTNEGWINAHFINDGTGPGQTAPTVPACNTTAAPPPAPAPSPPAFDARAATDTLLFHKTMAQFMVLSNLQWHNDQLDWSTDLCSVPLIHEPARSQPLGFDFRNPCRRHDFGYRNYKAQGRLTEDARQRIDNNFLGDMNAVCNTYTGLRAALGVTCRNLAARGYYEVVRGCGSSPTPACSTPILRRFGLIA